MNVVVADQRIQRGVDSTLTWQYTDENGVAADPGTVTVRVQKADGTDVVAAGAATNGTGTSPRTYTLPGVATLELLTVTWTRTSGGLTYTTLVEVAGRFYFTVAEARASDSTLADTAKYPDADVVRARHEVEDEFEMIADVAYIPHFRRATLDGSGTNELLLLDNELRTIRTIRIYSSATAYTSFTSTELADLEVDRDLVIRRPAGYVFDDTRRANVVVEYEFGFDAPPFDLKRAMLIRLRSRLNMPRSQIPDRATSYTVPDGGGTYRLDMPGAYKTGIPEVDAAYERWGRRDTGDGASDTPRPASRSIDFDPQRYSIFHGPRR